MDTSSKFSGKLAPVFERVESLSKLQRILIYCGTIALIVGVFVFGFYRPKHQEYRDLNSEYKKLDKQLTTAKNNARQLKKFEQKHKEARLQFELARRALPETREIPSLLASISQSGQDAGMKFLLFQPRGEHKKDFYAEIPVAIKVTGNYHNIAMFFDKIAGLSRIVNVNNIRLSSPKKGNELDASCTAVTYKFVDEEPNNNKKSKNKRARRRK